MIKICIHCECEFDTNSQYKRSAGGKINECADCVEELQTEYAIRHKAINTGFDSSQDLHIVEFENTEEASKFQKAKVDSEKAWN